ncbi:8-oxo-dGTP pyrophosphatase MutT (NUDIX family) [Nakamurella sp. UYEF19]|uniref:NUDIX hydrolase n=1 Tax=Nakamurella sp. UYEF19 TaxID=1756392 RepID=UPI0033921C91
MPPTRPVVELLAGYRPVDAAEKADVDRILEVADGAEDPWSQSIPLHLTASAVVVHPPTGRVLLRWHARQQAWLQIGGHGDPGESSPMEIALREGLEETGLPDLAPWPSSELVHAVIVGVVAKGDSPAHEHADLRFVLSTDLPDTVRPEKPDALLRWLTVDEAMGATSEANLQETLRRVGDLIAR